MKKAETMCEQRNRKWCENEEDESDTSFDNTWPQNLGHGWDHLAAFDKWQMEKLWKMNENLKINVTLWYFDMFEWTNVSIFDFPEINSKEWKIKESWNRRKPNTL